MERHNYVNIALSGSMDEVRVGATIRRSLKDDEYADVLGMPLQLAILIIVAGLSLVTIIAWFVLSDNTIPEIKFHESEGGDELSSIDEGTDTFFIRVVDKANPDDGLEGYIFSFSGCNAEATDVDVKTGSNGYAEVTLTTSTSLDLCDVSVTAVKSGDSDQRATSTLYVRSS
jgi:hypothetical protein